MRLVAIIGLLLMIALPSPINARSAPAERVDIYSDICFHEDEGEFLGSRLILLRSPVPAYAVLQYAQGVFTMPIVGRLEINGNSIVVTFSAAGLTGVTFRGTIDEHSIEGEFDDGRTDRSNRRRHRLLHQPSVGAEMPVCR